MHRATIAPGIGELLAGQSPEKSMFLVLENIAALIDNGSARFGRDCGCFSEKSQARLENKERRWS
jgi:hypothetical protein